MAPSYLSYVSHAASRSPRKDGQPRIPVIGAQTTERPSCTFPSLTKYSLAIEGLLLADIVVVSGDSGQNRQDACVRAVYGLWGSR